MSSPLFAWPVKAEFNRVVPKNKIYQHTRPGRSVRERFVQEVDQIVWKYKLAPETINLPPGKGVQEIQIFSITSRTENLSESVLRTIDHAIPFPAFFELTFRHRVRLVAAWKRPSENSKEKWVVDAYFQTAWSSSEQSREPLPIAIDLPSLYELLLRRLIPFPARPQESLRDLVKRANAIRGRQAECAKLEIKVHQEKQFNRRVELNQQLRTLRNELDSLSGPAPVEEPDASWKN
jgi:hypothetical protein